MPRPVLQNSGSGVRIRIALALLIVTCLIVGALWRTSSVRGSDNPLTPPPPPAIVPTPIGPPPGPPTPSPTPGTAISPTPAASTTTTATTSSSLRFSLDAVRLSKVNNPGNLKGLAVVRPGARTWLMMYYTVQALPKKLRRVTTYAVQYYGKTLFSVSYSKSESPKDVGRFSRYTVFTVPPNAPFGQYVYMATLTIGKKSRTRTWKFRIGGQTKEAGDPPPWVRVK